MKIGEKLKNGAIIICFANHAYRDEKYVLVYKPDHNEYATWLIDENGDTFHGHYFWNKILCNGLAEAMNDFKGRLGIFQICKEDFQNLAGYKDYVERKLDIDEIPFYFDQYLQANKDIGGSM